MQTFDIYSENGPKSLAKRQLRLIRSSDPEALDWFYQYKDADLLMDQRAHRQVRLKDVRERIAEDYEYSSWSDLVASWQDSPLCEYTLNQLVEMHNLIEPVEKLRWTFYSKALRTGTKPLSDSYSGMKAFEHRWVIEGEPVANLTHRKFNNLKITRAMCERLFKLDPSLFFRGAADYSFSDFSHSHFYMKMQIDSALFKGANLSHAVFDPHGFICESNFTGANLTGVTFPRYMSHCGFDNAVLDTANMERCKAGGGASYKNCSIKSANLKGVMLGGAELINTDFSFSDMRGARMAQGTLWNCKFDGCDLRDTSYHLHGVKHRVTPELLKQFNCSYLGAKFGSE